MLYVSHLPPLGRLQRSPAISVKNSYTCKTASSLLQLSANEIVLDACEEVPTVPGI